MLLSLSIGACAIPAGGPGVGEDKRLIGEGLEDYATVAVLPRAGSLDCLDLTDGELHAEATAVATASDDAILYQAQDVRLTFDSNRNVHIRGKPGVNAIPALVVRYRPRRLDGVCDGEGGSTWRELLAPPGAEGDRTYWSELVLNPRSGAVNGAYWRLLPSGHATVETSHSSRHHRWTEVPQYHFPDLAVAYREVRDDPLAPTEIKDRAIELQVLAFPPSVGYGALQGTHTVNFDASHRGL